MAETGTEGAPRPAWLAMIAGEVAAARRAGVPVEGLCLNPFLDHLGWGNERSCCNGLLGLELKGGERVPDQPLADELARQRELMAAR